VAEDELRRAIPGVAEVNSARDAAEDLPLGPVNVTDTTRDADGGSAENSPAAAPFFSLMISLFSLLSLRTPRLTDGHVCCRSKKLVASGGRGTTRLAFNY
jgi:hypothetical protein